MTTPTTNTPNHLAEFQAIKTKAEGLGINTKGMKKAEIMAEIAKIENAANETPATEVPVAEVQTTEVPKAETPATEAPKKLGRPIVPGSKRQIELAEKEKLRAEGKLKRGRPVVEGSKHQAKLAQRAEKIAKGIPLVPGRPKMEKPKVETKVIDVTIVPPAVTESTEDVVANVTVTEETVN